jgi:DNA polymerase-1
MVRKLLKEYPDATVAVVFDAKGKTFRDELFAQYKAHRPPMPDRSAGADSSQFTQIVRAMGLPLLVVEGVEADDVIGTLARQASEQRQIQDSDLHRRQGHGAAGQWPCHAGQHHDRHRAGPRPGVEQKFGVPPELIIDYLALIGDKVDNIPGVPGVGEKTALVAEQGLAISIPSMPTWTRCDADSVAQNQGEGNRDCAYLSINWRPSRPMATIRCDLELPIDLATLQYVKSIERAGRAVSRNWSSTAGSRELRQAACVSAPSRCGTSRPAADIVTEQQFERWLRELKAAAPFSCSTPKPPASTTWSAQLVGLVLSPSKPGEAAYLPCA